jgi:DNA polymerase-3 subunit delta'
MGFSEFLGNSKALASVRGMLAAGRVPGALLFAGPEGVGKKTLALMLAKALNCERLKDDFCGKCARCGKADEMFRAAREDRARRREIKDSGRRVEGLVYFDLQLIEPITRYILIEQIRQVRNVAYTRPFELGRRVFIIDQAQAVHWQAVDLLLKMLEEPPETTTFMLVCPSAHELRPTIRSRCNRVQFLPVEDSVIERILEEQARLPRAQLPLGVRIASGSIAKAKTLDLAEFERRRRPWLDYLDGLAGQGEVPRGQRGPSPIRSGSPDNPNRPNRPNWPNWPNWPMVFDSTKALTENRESYEETLSIGYALLRDLVHVLEAPEDTQVVNLDLAPRLKAWASNLGLTGIERLKSGLDQAYRLQVRNVNQQLGLDALAIEVSMRQEKMQEIL